MGCEQAGWAAAAVAGYFASGEAAGVEGAGYFGHVAIVEKINADGSVYTSNYNWYGNGGWDILSYVTFMPGPGVSFVWHP